MQTEKTIFDFLPFDKVNTQQTIALNALQSFVQSTCTDDFFILSGAAGTGKTSITSALINYVRDMQQELRVCAPTGRAARIIGNKSGVLADTVHSLIYLPEVNDAGQTTWLLKKNSISTPVIYIIDEASMVPSLATQNSDMYFAENPVLTDLKFFIKTGHEQSKIIFLGDDRQLPPVQEKYSRALDKDYLEKQFAWKGQFCQLTEIVRQNKDSYILSNATRIRESIDSNTEMPKIQACTYPSSFEAAKIYGRNFDVATYDSAVCIGRTHKQNNLMNALIRQEIFGGNIKPVVPGDMLLVCQSWSRAGARLDNGDHVIVEHIDWEKTEKVAGLHFVPIKIRYNNAKGGAVTIDDLMLYEILLNENHQLTPAQSRALFADRIRANRIFREHKKSADDKYIGALRLVHGYSITCHKAQGGEWNRVYVSTYGVKDAKWMYTAVTRAKNILEVF